MSSDVLCMGGIEASLGLGGRYGEARFYYWSFVGLVFQERGDGLEGAL